MVAALLAMATAMEVQTTERGGRSPLLVEGETMAASGMWLTPGQDAMPIYFVGHAEKDSFRVVFGPGHDDVERGIPVSGAGFQVWSLLETGSSYGLAVGFHHSNTTTKVRPIGLCLRDAVFGVPLTNIIRSYCTMCTCTAKYRRA